MTWAYTNFEQTIVARTNVDGSMESCLVSAIADWIAEGNTPAPYVEPPAPIPQIVSVTQGGLALIQLGLMDAVQAVITSLRADPVTNAAVLWAWDKATEWHRDSPALNTIAALAGITQTKMDEAFVLAKTIVA